MTEEDMERLRGVIASLRDDAGQTARSDMLLPCPFCGVEPYLQYWEGGWCTEARVVCPECHVSTARESENGSTFYIPAGEDVTKALVIEKAIASWNRSYERTCRNISKYGQNIAESGESWKELFDFKCSECGADVCADDMGSSPLEVDEEHAPLRYCPNCGARISKEEE